MSKVTCSVCGCACDESISEFCNECGDYVCDECSGTYEGFCQSCFDEISQNFE